MNELSNQRARRLRQAWRRGLQFAVPALLGTLATPNDRAEAQGALPTFSNPLEITNDFWPFVQGRVTVAAGAREGSSDRELHRFLDGATRSFAWNGTEVECSILREEKIEDGQLIGTTELFLAQSDDGAVYMFGELSTGEDDDGEDDDDDWVVGGVIPGGEKQTMHLPNPLMLMPAAPKLGDTWSLETPPLGDEVARITGVNQTLHTPSGTYFGCVQVHESSVADRDEELKWYAPGIGWIQTANDAEVEALTLVATSLGSAAMRVVYAESDDVGRVEIAIEARTSLRNLRAHTPNGGNLANLCSPGASRSGEGYQLGQIRVLLETPEISLDAIRSAYPSGRYCFFAESAQTGELLYEEFNLGHSRLGSPIVTYPVSGKGGVPAYGWTATWLPMRHAAAYRLILRDRASGAELAVDLAADLHAFDIPAWMKPGTQYMLELQALDADGNVAVTEVPFRTVD